MLICMLENTIELFANKLAYFRCLEPILQFVIYSHFVLKFVEFKLTDFEWSKLKYRTFRNGINRISSKCNLEKSIN